MTQPTGTASMLAVPFSMIPAQDIVPLWPGWLARRHVNLVTAPGGTSKGLWTVDVAARVTTGKPWPGEPDDAIREPEAVVIIAPEDDPNESVAPRLAAAGADTSLVFNLTVLADGSPFILPDSLPELKAAMAEIRKATGREVGLVVIDPLMAVIERTVSTNIGARRVLSPLEKLAHDEDVCVVLTHHTVKSGATAGSKAITDAVRIALRIARPDKTSDARVLSYEKTNIASATGSIRYEVIEDGANTHIEYPVDSPEASSRGYTILPYQGSTEAQHATPVSAPDYQVRWAVSGGPVKRLGTSYKDAGEAMRAVEQHAGRPLTWQHGDSGAVFAALMMDGKPGAYTIWPNNAP